MSKNKKIKSGDTVNIRWISTHDKNHNRRHDLLFRNAKVISIAISKHPSMGGYRGESPWYKATIQIEKSNESIEFDFIQMNFIKNSAKIEDARTTERELKKKITRTRIPDAKELTFILKMEMRKDKNESETDIPF